MLKSMKILFLKNYINLALIGDDSLSISERMPYLYKSLLIFGPIALFLDVFHLWFETNKIFATGTVAFIFINMLFGAIMHKLKRTFVWQDLLVKTMRMVVVVGLTYFILEIILKIAGSNIVTEAFRTSLQVATLFYPGGKILKNIFILSKGEHPPKWIMEKMYNFQKNGDLATFTNNTTKDDIK
jgi:hypothetical protein